MELDHLAVATEDQHQAWPRYAGDLAGRWTGGGSTTGFALGQVRYGGGMKVEVLEPHRSGENDFVRRFLDRHGPGPHHLTFEVSDLRSALDTVEAAGHRPVDVDLSHPFWKEAFLRPRDALGVLVQLAQPEVAEPEGDGPPAKAPPGFPTPATEEPAELVHFAHAVASLDHGLRLFCQTLGGAEVGRGDDEGARWVDLAWPGRGRLRLLAPSGPSELGRWLGDRPGRVHHMAFGHVAPARLRGAEPVGPGVWEVAPEANLGTRLVLLEQSPRGTRPGDRFLT